MNKRTNIFTIPNWMKNLCARVPEGTYTPDQVAASLELNLLLNGDAASLRSSISTLIPLVPAKRQAILKSFLDASDSEIIGAVQQFIDSVNVKLAPILKEQEDARPKEKPAGTSGESISDDSQLPDDWGFEDGRSLRGPKPSSRGNRAVRAAKRQSFDS